MQKKCLKQAGLLLLLTISGCSSYTSISQITAMPEPLIYKNSKLKERIYTDDISKNNRIFYVTDREPVHRDTEDDATFYAHERSSVLRVGTGEVASSPLNEKNKIYVPEINEYGYLASALPYGKLSAAEEINDMKPADTEFAGAINKKLANSNQKDIFIYVHGYKTVFENPLLVSSEFWQYMNNDGVFIAYSWPATPKRLAYFKDIETAQLSAHNFRLLIEYLANNTDAKRIHIIGYSAGTRVVITAVRQLALKYHHHSETDIKSQLRIGNIILAASDHDPRIFAAAIGHELLNIPDMMTIYMSATDDALSLSRLFLRENRLGQFINTPTDMQQSTKQFFERNKKLFFINASDAERAGFSNGHGYYFNSPWVSSDLLLTLKYSLKPKARGLNKTKGKLYWSFSEDYADNIEKINIPSIQ